MLPIDEPLTRVAFTLNGEKRSVDVLSWTILLDLLRSDLGLTGTKKGCDHGQCGACTVLRDGRRFNACLQLAVMQEGRDLITIKGLAKNGQTHPLQQAFIDHYAFQWGYCTSGQICSVMALIAERHAGSPLTSRCGE